MLDADYRYPKEQRHAHARHPWPAGTPCWVDLAVPDVTAAARFYGEVIGSTFSDTGEEYGHYHIAQTNGRAAAAIGPLQQEGQPTAWTVYLASDDADATAKLVAENGGTVVAEPFDIPRNGRMAIALDPTGGAFGVWQSAGQNGIEVYNEPGALVWEDARLVDPAAGMAFYSAVFRLHVRAGRGCSRRLRDVQRERRGRGWHGRDDGSARGHPEPLGTRRRLTAAAAAVHRRLAAGLAGQRGRAAR